MAKTFREWNVEQGWLLPPSVLDFVPADHVAHFVRETVREQLDLAAVLRHGPMALAERGGRATVLAECCEALIGAVYGIGGGPAGGLEAVLAWLEPHWLEELPPLLADPHAHNWKSALQEWSQGRGLGLPQYDTQERSRLHGDPCRFHCRVSVAGRALGEGWGGGRREAEQQAARGALASLDPQTPAPISAIPGSAEGG